MRLELLKPYGMSAKGDVLPDVPKSVADELIKRGIAKAMDPAQVSTKPFAKRLRRK